MAGLGPTALFDLPWMPLYIGICFLFHPVIGATAVAGALLLVAITALAEWRSRAPAKAASEQAAARNALALASQRNAEVVQAMGMGRRLGERWSETSERFIDAQQRSSDVAGGLGTISKVLRIGLQSAVLGVGAYLVIEQQATAGIIIASSILTARAVVPVELAIAHWRGFVAARQSWKRLRELFAAFPAQRQPMALPELKAGNALGVIGPSASGKSSLARLLVGVWPTLRGKVRLDGAALGQWTPEALGEHIGYLPQDVELFAGTVAENIARFEPEPQPDAVVAAAKAARVHDLILRLPKGYETEVGESGHALSAGQRQRIALARALYRDPFLVVLDEPNSNLDAEGEQALTAAITAARARGQIVVVVAHRPSALAAVDHLLVMGEGQVQAFGPKGEVLGKVVKRPPGALGAAEAREAPQLAAGGAALKVVGA